MGDLIFGVYLNFAFEISVLYADSLHICILPARFDLHFSKPMPAVNRSVPKEYEEAECKKKINIWLDLG